MKKGQIRKIGIATMVVMVLFITWMVGSSSVLAASNATTISLSDSQITVNGETISTNSSKSVYLSSSMNNGGTSDDATSANIEINNVITITAAGTYEFSGTLSDGQIAVNSNNISGEVVILLNNVNITCKEAPAIFVYNQSTSSNCTVTIRLATGSNNTISGGKMKQSVADWSDQSSILYYIDKDYDDDGTYYERYKYDGAISSDISLTFEGEGNLTVNALKKEGIESKGNITINSGNYIVNSLDDGINACTDHESVITINGGTVLVNVTSEAEEGDGIDSNGSLIINGGYVYAFASSTSQDYGLDSDDGTYINGGYVVATGNMADSVSTESKQIFKQMQFSEKVTADSLLIITDENKTPLLAFQGDRSYSILTVSSPNLTDTVLVYEGGAIEGTENNGFYTQITSYTLGTEKQYSSVEDRGMGDFGSMERQTDTSSNIYYYVLSGVGATCIICLIAVIIAENKQIKAGKETILLLVLGLLIGAILATGGMFIYHNTNTTSQTAEMGNGGPMQMQQMDGNFTPGEMPGQAPDSQTN